jgi:hypothetical protein
MDSLVDGGVDVHKDCTGMVVVSTYPKVGMEAIIETGFATGLDFSVGSRGTMHATCEERTHAAWR